MLSDGLPKTVKGQRTKDKILETALILFILRGYEKTTIAEIIEHSGMSRGSIFYYYKDKYTLYKEVMEKYIISAIIGALEFEKKDDITLEEFIGLYSDSVVHGLQSVMELSQCTHADYLRMALEAMVYYPGFDIKINEALAVQNRNWRELIISDMEKGILRKDLDVEKAVQKFRNAYLGYMLENALNNSGRVGTPYPIFMEVYRTLE